MFILIKNYLKKIPNFTRFRRNKKKNFLYSFIYLISLIFYCEFLIYYIIEFQCKWPHLHVKSVPFQPVKTMILSDVHMLGPRRGHWFDKLRREWQMHRSFQTAITLFNPEVVFILGDLFDEGQWVDHNEFKEYIDRFYKLFKLPQTTKLIAVVGNHDIGFHYRMHPYFVDRFEEIFNNTGILLYTIKDVHFVTINSMAMENDGCHFCDKSMQQLKELSRILNCAKDSLKCRRIQKPKITYSQPIILQHFPMYRSSDEDCFEQDLHDIEVYREKWEVLSKDATDILGELLNPRLVFSGHSHYFCKLENRLKIEEYTLASFNWRNLNNPSYILAKFTPDTYAVSVCYLPKESTVIKIYVIGLILFLFYIICLLQ